MAPHYVFEPFIWQVRRKAQHSHFEQAVFKGLQFSQPQDALVR